MIDIVQEPYLPAVLRWVNVGRLRFPADSLFAPVEGLDLSCFPMRIDVMSMRDPTRMGLQLGLRLRVRDRVTKGWTWTMLTAHLGDSVIAEGEAAVDLVMWHFAHEAVRHELDECWLVGGERVHDPHADEAIR